MLCRPWRRRGAVAWGRGWPVKNHTNRETGRTGSPTDLAPSRKQPVKQRPERPAARPKPRPARWTAAVAELRQLQAEYEAWRDQLPESLADSRTAELLEGVCDVDLDTLDVELPRGFGRD